jgi:hypothetical protein
MHCGLGELYFAMTGLEPNASNVSEDDVIKIAVERTSVYTSIQREIDKSKAIIQKMNIDNDMKRNMLNIMVLHDLENTYQYFDAKLERLRGAFEAIVKINDQDSASNMCSNHKTYKARAKRVANQFRKIAALLSTK